MQWQTGDLQLLCGSDRFHLCTPDGRRTELHCGDPLEIRLDGRWERGRVEWSTRLGWHWTNNQMDRRMLAGDEARVWASRFEWPPREQQRPSIDR